MTLPTIEPRYFQLPATPTYRRRRIGWFPGGEGRLGTLRIVVERTKAPSDSTEADEYAVTEYAHPELPAGVRCFALTKDDGTAYLCVVGTDARCQVRDRCECEAGRHRRMCKHVSGLRLLIEKWVI